MFLTRSTGALALVVALGSTSAFAVDVRVERDAAAAPAAVWAAIGDFCGIAKWHPAIAKCEVSKKGADTFRTLTLKGGGTVYEKQLTFDPKTMSYSYTIEESPLPVKNYKAKMVVTPKATGSTLTWTANFDAKGASDAEAAKTIRGIFEGGLDVLQKTK